eukprot:scaffold2561_cov72-Skeletonema_dohrnii-CCMP3373.AAC.3
MVSSTANSAKHKATETAFCAASHAKKIITDFIPIPSTVIDGSGCVLHLARGLSGARSGH